MVKVDIPSTNIFSKAFEGIVSASSPKSTTIFPIVATKISDKTIVSIWLSSKRLILFKSKPAAAHSSSPSSQVN